MKVEKGQVIYSRQKQIEEQSLKNVLETNSIKKYRGRNPPFSFYNEALSFGLWSLEALYWTESCPNLESLKGEATGTRASLSPGSNWEQADLHREREIARDKERAEEKGGAGRESKW